MATTGFPSTSMAGRIRSRWRPISAFHNRWSNRDTGLKVDELKDMAKIAHGRYFGFAEAAQLPAEIAKSVEAARSAGIKPEDREIWDTPLLFVLAFGLMVAEWIVRRRCGLA